MSEVLLQVDNAVAVVTLNRPGRGNGWTLEMEYAYFDALEECTRRADIRVVVITGTGKQFCVGADLDELDSIGAAAPAEWAPRDPRSPAYALRMPKPVIAAVNGACAGMGVVQAAMSDIRFSAPEVKFTTAFARRGLVAEHGLSWVLPRIVGTGRALDLLMSGRVALGREMADMGFVDFLVEEPGQVLDAALDYAGELVRYSAPESMAAAKFQVYADQNRTLEAALENADALMNRSLARPSFLEGVTSYRQDRVPDFPAITESFGY